MEDIEKLWTITGPLTCFTLENERKTTARKRKEKNGNISEQINL